ncbi:hypothetical protein C4588_07260 [Candidatus Parcubacteria bacterium]|nr:MAG: hypothetical protein C4588_07260 [Candidatus Parcubacteria bacterium]
MPDIRVGAERFNRNAKRLDARKLAEAKRSHGVNRTTGIIVDGLMNGTLNWRQFSIRDLWEGLVGPCAETLGDGRVFTHGLVRSRRTELVDSQAFSYATGNVIVNRVQEAYDSQPSVLDQLVTPMQSNFKMEPIVGFQAFGSMNVVPEGQQYGDHQMLDKATMNPEPDKKGGMIAITEETIIFDQTGQIMTRAQRLGEANFTDREREGVRRIQDLTGYRSYYPVVNGQPTQTNLYRATAGGTEWYRYTVNQTGANPLNDWTSLETAFAIFNAMVDENGDPILAVPRQILVPFALYGTALRIINATEIRSLTNSSANITLTPSPLVIQQLGGSLMPLHSPFMDDSTTWYIGDFPRQFVERTIIPPQVQEIGGMPDRDVVARFRVRRKMQVEATDDKFVVRCPAA